MSTLPQLLQEDVAELQTACQSLLEQAEASIVLLTDKAGYRLVQAGDVAGLDTTSLAALASGSFLATQQIASIINEPNFSNVYQQGEKWGMFISNVDAATVLIVLFPSQVGLGVVKYYVSAAVTLVAAQLEKAKSRGAATSLDLAMLNVPDSLEFFKQKSQ